MPPHVDRPEVRPRLVLAVIGLVAIVGVLWARTSLSLAGTSATPSGPSLAVEPCPLVWPLGLDGFQPRELFNSHGQLVKLGTFDEYLHAGIDIGGCVGDEVYAAAPGTVVYVDPDPPAPGGQYNEVIVSDGDDLTRGFKYQHLEEVEVNQGDTVRRDELLGTLVKWAAQCGFDHCHFQRVKVNETVEGDSSQWKTYLDDGNPLPMLVARPDGEKPTLGTPSTDGGAASAPLRFFAQAADGSPGAELTDYSSLKGDMDVVARVADLFPGIGSVTCSEYSCCDVPPSREIVPHRLTLCVLTPIPDPTGTSTTVGDRSVFDAQHVNTIDFDVSIIEDLELIKRADRLFHPDSASDYTNRELYVILTNSLDSSTGTWSPAKGSYRLQVTAEDTSGNVAVATMDVTVVD